MQHKWVTIEIYPCNIVQMNQAVILLHLINVKNSAINW